MLTALAQVAHQHGNRNELADLLARQARAAARAGIPQQDADLHAALRARASEFGDHLAIVRRRLATEKDDSIYEALRLEYKQLDAELTTARRRLEKEDRARQTARATDPGQDVAAAIALLDDIERLISDPNARAEINGRLVRLGVRLGLSFTEGIKGKKRKIRKLASGIMAFGDAPLPVKLYGPDNAEEPEDNGCQPQLRHDPGRETTQLGVFSENRPTSECGPTGEGPAADSRFGSGPDTVELSAQSHGRQRVGVSFTKVHRGDRI
ncbi:MAG: hypothetical protein ACYSUI_00845 [Planctomycetota bacterium]